MMLSFLRLEVQNDAYVMLIFTLLKIFQDIFHKSGAIFEFVGKMLRERSMKVQNRGFRRKFWVFEPKNSNFEAQKYACWMLIFPEKLKLGCL